MNGTNCIKFGKDIRQPVKCCNSKWQRHKGNGCWNLQQNHRFKI